MELSLELGYLRRMRGTDRQRPIENIAALCRDAGFRCVDYTPEFLAADWEARAQHDREVLDAAGAVVVQTHAPYNRYGAFPEEKLKDYYWNLLRGSKILGARYVVVHADEYRTVDHYDEQEIEDFDSVEYYTLGKEYEVDLSGMDSSKGQNFVFAVDVEAGTEYPYYHRA